MENIKVIITFKKGLFINSIDKIYFDTYGKYQFVKLAESKSDWNIEHDFNYTKAYEQILLFNNDKLKYNGHFVPYFSNSLIIYCDKNIIYKLSKIKDNLFQINFNNNIFTYEDIFYISDKIIRLIGNKFK